MQLHKKKRQNHHLIVFNATMLVIFLANLLKQILLPNLDFIDVSIAQIIPQLRTPLLNSIMIAFTRFGDPLSMGIFSAIITILLLLQKKRKQARILALAIVTGVILVELIIKPLVDRLRPPNGLIETLSMSFPSGHATTSTITFGFIIYAFSKNIENRIFKTIFIVINSILFIGIGFSRIYLGVHWLSDVIGGFALGFFVLSGTIIILNKLQKKRLL